MAKKKKQLRALPRAQAEVEVMRERKVELPSEPQTPAKITAEPPAQSEKIIEPPPKLLADTSIPTAFD